VQQRICTRRPGDGTARPEETTATNVTHQTESEKASEQGERPIVK